MNIYKTLKLYHFWLLNVYSSENLRKLQPFQTGSVISKVTLYQFVKTHWFRESLQCQRYYLETVLRKEIQKSCMQMTWTHPSLPPLQVNSVSCTLCKSYTGSTDSLAWLDETAKEVERSYRLLYLVFTGIKNQTFFRVRCSIWKHNQICTMKKCLSKSAGPPFSLTQSGQTHPIWSSTNMHADENCAFSCLSTLPHRLRKSLIIIFVL